jgi:hypothetical protein
VQSRQSTPSDSSQPQKRREPIGNCLTTIDIQRADTVGPWPRTSKWCSVQLRGKRRGMGLCGPPCPMYTAHAVDVRPQRLQLIISHQAKTGRHPCGSVKCTGGPLERARAGRTHSSRNRQSRATRAQNAAHSPKLSAGRIRSQRRPQGGLGWAAGLQHTSFGAHSTCFCTPFSGDTTHETCSTHRHTVGSPCFGAQGSSSTAVTLTNHAALLLMETDTRAQRRSQPLAPRHAQPTGAVPRGRTGNQLQQHLEWPLTPHSHRYCSFISKGLDRRLNTAPQLNTRRRKHGPRRGGPSRRG